MNILQELIIWLNAEADKASINAKKSIHYVREYDEQYGRLSALSATITKIELLLKHDESKQPQPHDCANTMLGEVPHGVNAQSGENLKAVEGATPVVGQNLGDESCEAT